jgi:hypothetical protein
MHAIVPCDDLGPIRWPIKKPRHFTQVAGFLMGWNLSCLDIGSLFPFWTLADFEGNFLAFLQGLEAVHVNGGKMCENIFPTVIRGNEAKTLGIAKPLDGTRCH